jgi:hypothetical protein
VNNLAFLVVIAMEASWVTARAKVEPAGLEPATSCDIA